MAADHDPFLIASFALWAGDFRYFETLMRKFASPRQTLSLLEGIDSPEDIMRAVGTLRLRQLLQRRSEFNRLLAQPLRDFRRELSDDPLTIESAHLRAAVWRTDSREFVMQAYLTDLDWQDRLFANAQALAAASSVSERREQRDELEETVAPAASNLPIYQPLGGRWVVTGNPFIRVALTDLGLLEANALWTGATIPEHADSLRKPFAAVLASLEISEIGVTPPA
jgi:hypothetical protein